MVCTTRNDQTMMGIDRVNETSWFANNCSVYPIREVQEEKEKPLPEWNNDIKQVGLNSSQPGWRGRYDSSIWILHTVKVMDYGYSL